MPLRPPEAVGLVAVIVVVSPLIKTLPTVMALVEPNLMLVWFANRPVAVIVTIVPPAVVPVTGLRPVMTGWLAV
jgi:hypothetical protein